MSFFSLVWIGDWTDGRLLADENPQWVAQQFLRFLAEDDGIPAVDLSYLKDRVGM